MSRLEFHTLRVAEIRRETDSAVSVRFDVPEALEAAYRFEAGQYLTLRRDLDGADIRRNYSVCVSPLDGELRVAVKQLPGGVFSGFVNARLQAGDRMEVAPPAGRFTWRFDALAARSYVGFAAGSGITPVLSILKTALAMEPASRFTLFYANRSTGSVMFLEELSALKNRFMDRLAVFHFLEDEEEEFELFNGRLDRAKCDRLLSSLVDPESLDAAFICGPGPMMDAAEAALLEAGVARDRILIERFATATASAEQLAAAEFLQAQAQGLRIGIVLDGRRSMLVFDAAKGAILDNARAAGLPAPFACKGGVCATCRAKIISGTAEMKLNYGLSEQEVAQGYILTCQAIPTSADVVVDYDG